MDFPAPPSRFTAPANSSEAEVAGPAEPRLPLRMNPAYVPLHAPCECEGLILPEIFVMSDP
jgi:hypothetical protein